MLMNKLPSSHQVRCFGRYNSSLWDDVFAEFGPITERDLIIVNFGAWCATSDRPG